MGKAFERIRAGLEEAVAYAKADHGTVFPPRDEWDVAAYDIDDVVEGYRAYEVGDLPPGPNRSPGYRWGWANCRRDFTREPDGFDELRHRYFHLSRRPN